MTTTTDLDASVTDTPRRRRVRRSLTAVGAVLALLLAGLVAAVSAGATTYGDTYSTNSFECTSNQYTGQVVNAYPPAMYTTAPGGTNIFWDATLYRWNGASFQPYLDSGWNQSVGYGNRDSYWVRSGGLEINNFYQFANLPHGYYAVHNAMYWQADGGSAMFWGYVTGNTSQYYCGL